MVYRWYAQCQNIDGLCFVLETCTRINMLQAKMRFDISMRWLEKQIASAAHHPSQIERVVASQ